jgi:hypothetical protein
MLQYEEEQRFFQESNILRRHMQAYEDTLNQVACLIDTLGSTNELKDGGKVFANSFHNLTLALNFDGRFLLLRIVRGNEILRFSYRAVSGRSDKNGKFDYSKERQGMVDVGPIPEGYYHINPQEIQYTKDRSLYDKFKGRVGRGSFPGGEYAWGIGRVWIYPQQVVVNGVIRKAFSIHGGSESGSGGCIDLVDNDKSFFDNLVKYRGNITYISLMVKYLDQ